jgi:hypothetical protein
MQFCSFADYLEEVNLSCAAVRSAGMAPVVALKGSIPSSSNLSSKTNIKK